MLDIFLSELLQHQGTRLAVEFIISIAAIALVREIGSRCLAKYRLRALPLVNGLGLFESDKRSRESFLFNAQSLLDDGYAKSSKAFRVQTDNAQVVVLAPECSSEIRNDDRFSFTHLLAEDFLGHIPAFVNFSPHNGLNDMAKEVLTKKLNPSLGLVTKDISAEATLTFRDQWTDNTEWHALNMKETILEIVARISSRVFLGPELCRNPAWLRITVDYTMNLFFGVMALKKWNRLLHPIVWRFVPEVRKVRQQIEQAVRLIQPVVDERIAGSRSSAASSSKAKYTDAIQWAHELADGRPYHPALLQLGFSLAAIHTTTDHLSQALYDLCSYPEYIEPLRDELVTVLKESGMTKAGLFKLKLMDSFMKESQRLKPGAMLMMRRLVMEDVTLSNGVFLPQGTQIGFPLRSHFNPKVYSEPDKFDGYRYVKMADDPEKEMFRHFVSTSPEHMAFGFGKHSCPGRFFAAIEVKIALCHILLKYDFKLAEGTTPTVMKMGWNLVADPMAQLIIKRREGRDESILLS
ncbi:putative cytochrome P450 monooxygenase [Dothidotthia symphoricarpi CBS 119687]|uniref:Putative cytochrome P450 monooxygenase n=1 Tax=Dothidotthia symphoricarpi CBS 119687 TaxID=1392245 RepID=A0A6A6AIE0_9PLEO|nr:putative cytochrome P450 monooxygenase [Dothidotthia symphoricarpi CBS 119687]KAF2130677.1 putative cytochrome P450 monooxygenase [Dothidotthia symphoricarpi CBS 119687]